MSVTNTNQGKDKMEVGDQVKITGPSFSGYTDRVGEETFIVGRMGNPNVFKIDDPKRTGLCLFRRASLEKIES